MIIEDAKIVSNELFSPEYGLIGIATEKLGKDFKAGQFLQMEIPGRPDLVLRRPMSPLRIKKRKSGWLIEVLYKLCGAGTRHLAGLAPAQDISVLGPLGRGFRAPVKGGEAVLVAGGTGLGPIFMLAEKLCSKHKVSFYYGAKCAAEIHIRSEIEKLPAKIVLCTDDGSLGGKGVVTDILSKQLIKNGGNPCIYACGPVPMLKAVQKLAVAQGLKLQVSLEERMGCGMGACLSCAVKSADGGYRMVCKDGPVFNADEMVL